MLLKKWIVRSEESDTVCDKWWLEHKGKEYRLYIHTHFLKRKMINNIIEQYPAYLLLDVVAKNEKKNIRIYKKTQAIYKTYDLELRVNNIYNWMKYVDILFCGEVVATCVFPVFYIGERAVNFILIDMFDDVVDNAYLRQLRRNKIIEDILN